MLFGQQGGRPPWTPARLPPQYRERLSVPVLWWVLAAGFTLTMLLAIGLYLGPAWGIGAAGVSVAAAAVLFVRAALVIVIEPERIRIGRAEIDHRYISGCRALDAEATQRRAGVEADARAHLVLRPYVATAVEITLADPADPVPYWLVSSRLPRQLAATLTTAVGRPATRDEAVASAPGQDDPPRQTVERSSSKGGDPLGPPRA
jgi:hypothetical protein